MPKLRTPFTGREKAAASNQWDQRSAAQRGSPPSRCMKAIHEPSA